MFSTSSLETLLLGVNHLIGSKIAHIFQIAREGRGNDFGPGAFRELHGIGTDIPGRAVHQHSFPGLDLPIVEGHLHAVLATTGTNAASIWLRRRGFAAIMPASATAYWA